MPPDLPNEQALSLKKRARRRLVGAIALVLLMIIILPRILEDRAALAPQEAIKITMSTSPNDQEIGTLGDKAAELKFESKPELEPKSELEATPVALPTDPKLPEAISTKAPIAANLPTDTKSEKEDDLPVNKAESKVIQAKNNSIEYGQDKSVVKTETVIVPELKPSEAKDVKISDAKVISTPKLAEENISKKNPTNFTVQVGVYSDAGNVKYLQGKIKEIGLSSRTERIQTPKGEKIRLKAGSFTTRPEAVKAQSKLQKIGLAGMVVANE